MAITWSEVRTTGNYTSASNCNGNYLLAGDGWPGYAWRSDDSGANWYSTMGNSRAWSFCQAISDTGTYQILGVYGDTGHELYFSSDSGANWSTTGMPHCAHGWAGAAISSGATPALMMVGANAGRVYISTDQGANWSETQPSGSGLDAYWAVACSSDGSVRLAGHNGGRLYIYSGGSWAETRPAGDANKSWQGICMNGDGTVMYASVYGGRAYKYSGGSWAEIYPTGSAANSTYEYFSCDNTGNIAITGTDVRLWATTNGSTWAEERPGGANSDIEWLASNNSVSPDGTKIITGAYGGKLYTGAVSTSGISSVDGLAKASIASIDGLAIASVKSINGLE